MTEMTSGQDGGQPKYENTVCPSVRPSLHLSQVCECVNTTVLLQYTWLDKPFHLYPTPHLPNYSYYKNPNPPAYMPCFLHLLPLLFFLSFFHCPASQQACVGEKRSATAASLFQIPSLHYTFYPVPEVSEFGLPLLSGLFLSSLSPVFILTLPGVQVVKDDALL